MHDVHERMNGSRRGSAVVVVVWAISICALIVSSLLVFSGRQSMLGVETVDDIRARWTARAGVESTIAVLAYHTMEPDPDNALALTLDMEDVAFGEIEDGGKWSISHNDLDGQSWPGPKCNLLVNHKQVCSVLFFSDFFDFPSPLQSQFANVI